MKKSRLKSQLIHSARLIGLLAHDVQDWFSDANDVDVVLVESLIEERKQARAEKNFERADAIRKELTELGIEIEDTQGETRWKTIR